MPQQIANYVQTTLAANMTNSQLTLVVASAAGFPTIGTFRMVIKDQAPATTYEIVEVASVSGTTFTLSASGRGLEGTTGIAHTTGAFVSNDITAGMLTSYSAQGVGNLGGGSTASAIVTANQGPYTVLTDFTGLSVTVTIPANRLIKITGFAPQTTTVATDTIDFYIREGTTVLQTILYAPGFAGGLSAGCPIILILVPTAGVHTYKLSGQRNAGTGNITMSASSQDPAFIVVEDIGPAT